MDPSNEFATSSDLKKFKEEIIDEFHIISERLMDHVKLLAEGHSGIVKRLNHIEERLEQIEKKNEHQHIETRSLIKLSFPELDKRLSDLESQIKELQEWKKTGSIKIPNLIADLLKRKDL